MSEAEQRASFQRWLVLAVVIVGTFMAVLDVTIVNVVLPKIMTAFGANAHKLEELIEQQQIGASDLIAVVGYRKQYRNQPQIYSTNIRLLDSS